MVLPKSGTAALFTQLPLGMRLREGATFANFYLGTNHDVVRLLQNEITAEHEGFVYLWGNHSTGKTHLLQALCHLAATQGYPSAYLPLREATGFSSEVLEGLEHLHLVAVDDVDAVAGNRAWETALFHLYNRIREQPGRLVVAGRCNPAALGVTLADLRSRLAGCLVLQLRPLDDDDKEKILRQRARQFGMDMPEEVAAYLLRRHPRDMTTLFALMEVLDQASLAAQRKLTIPFVKEVLQRMDGRGEKQIQES